MASQGRGAITRRQIFQKHEFFRAQEDDVQQAQRDAADHANQVHGFDDHVSAVVSWLRETGIADHVCGFRKDVIRTAIAVPPLADESNLRTIIEATDEQLAVWQNIYQIAERRRVNPIGEDNEEGDEEGKELKERLLELWTLLFCHTTGARRYESPLLSFCAMLSIKPSRNGWMEPGNFNSSLSAIIWVVQLLAFYDSALRNNEAVGTRWNL